MRHFAIYSNSVITMRSVNPNEQQHNSCVILIQTGIRHLSTFLSSLLVPVIPWKVENNGFIVVNA